MKCITEEFIMWLRKQHPGTMVKIRDFLIHYLSMLFGIATFQASLGIRVLRRNGTIEDRGVVSLHEVTDAFVAELVDALQAGGVAAFDDYKYHDSGTDNTAEDPTDTGLGAACGDARTTGTQIEGATANIYKSVATHTYGGTYAIVEHGLFNAATVGTLMDRSVFSVVNVESGDKIEFTYQLTCVAGG